LENRAIYERISKNITEAEKPQMTSQYELHAGWAMHTPKRPGTRINTRAHTHKYVTLIAFLRQL
jgi:hypothetical protein